MSISKFNWSKGFFRLWLSASIVWWVALTAGVVAAESREAQTEFLRAQGIECSLDSATPLFDFPSACQPSEGESSNPSLPLRDLLYLTTERLRTSTLWTRWIYFVWVPLGILLTAILFRIWTRWIRFGFALNLDVEGAQEHTIGDYRHSGAAIHTISVEHDSDEGRANAVGDQQSELRAKLVRATQMLNKLDNELVELGSRLVGPSRELAQGLRQAIPGFGRRFIALVQALDKQGLAPDNLRLFDDSVRVRRDSKVRQS